MTTDNITILIIDDQLEEDAFVKPRVAWLQEAGYRVLKSSTLSGAWKIINEYYNTKNKNNLLILLDIMIPTHDDKEWMLETKDIPATEAGIFFCQRIKLKYPDALIAFHSVRTEREKIIHDAVSLNKIRLVEKGIQDENQFLKEILTLVEED